MNVNANNDKEDETHCLMLTGNRYIQAYQTAHYHEYDHRTAK